MDIDVAVDTQAVLDVDGATDLGRIANRRSYPGTVEIEIRAGFCDPGELLAVLLRSGWRRLTARRRGWDRPSRLGVR